VPWKIAIRAYDLLIRCNWPEGGCKKWEDWRVGQGQSDGQKRRW